MADASQNKPIKEFTFAIFGIILFLAMILLIAISAFLRPAGDHVVAEAPTEEGATEMVAAEANAEPVAEETAPVEEPAIAEGKASSETAPAAPEGKEDAGASAEDVATDTAVEENVLPPNEGQPAEAKPTQELKEAAAEVKEEKAAE